MWYEYKQEQYPVSAGKFDGSLNSMALAGWKVESIDRLNDAFLVTYSRPEEQELVITRFSSRDSLPDVFSKFTSKGLRLVGITGFEIQKYDSSNPRDYRPGEFVYTVVWEKVRL